MNPRIRELAEQADRWAQEMTWSADPRYGDRPRSDLFEGKFAELIVRECAELCLKHETFQGLFNEMEYRKGRHFSTMMKEHFGVEE